MYVNPIVDAVNQDTTTSSKARSRAGRWIYLHPRLSLLCFTLATLVALAGLAEGVFWALNERKASRRGIEIGGWEANGVMFDRRTYDGQKVYEQTYRLDSERYRITPGNPENPARSIYFFGGSFAFGQGVADNETLPYFVAAKWPGTASYNRAWPAQGTAHVYEQVLALDSRADGDESLVIGVYVMIPNHVRRATGSMRIVSTWGRDFPCYRIDSDGEPELLGTYLEARPWRTRWQRWLAREQLMKHFGVDVPITLRQQDLEYTAALINACRRAFKERTGSNSFLVAVYPERGERGFSASDLADFLEKKSIPHLNYSTLYDINNPNYVIKQDTHPTALAHATIAEAVVRELQ